MSIEKFQKKNNEEDPLEMVFLLLPLHLFSDFSNIFCSGTVFAVISRKLLLLFSGNKGSKPDGKRDECRETTKQLKQRLKMLQFSWVEFDI